MASSKTTTRTIRIANEVAEFFKEKALNRAVESLYGLLTDGSLKFDGEELRVECTHQNSKKSEECTHQKEEKTENRGTPKNDFEAIAEMANLMQVSTEKLVSDFRQLLEDGTLYYSGTNLVNPRYEEFERICEAKKQDPDRMMANVVRSMGG